MQTWPMADATVAKETSSIGSGERFRMSEKYQMLPPDKRDQRPRQSPFIVFGCQREFPRSNSFRFNFSIYLTAMEGNIFQVIFCGGAVRNSRDQQEMMQQPRAMVRVTSWIDLLLEVHIINLSIYTKCPGCFPVGFVTDRCLCARKGAVAFLLFYCIFCDYHTLAPQSTNLIHIPVLDHAHFLQARKVFDRSELRPPGSRNLPRARHSFPTRRSHAIPDPKSGDTSSWLGNRPFDARRGRDDDAA